MTFAIKPYPKQSAYLYNRVNRIFQFIPGSIKTVKTLIESLQPMIYQQTGQQQALLRVRI